MATFTECDWCGTPVEKYRTVSAENSQYNKDYSLPFPPKVCKDCRALLWDGDFNCLAVRHETREYARDLPIVVKKQSVGLSIAFAGIAALFLLAFLLVVFL